MDDDVGDINEEYVQDILRDLTDSYMPSVSNCRLFVRKIMKSRQNELQLMACCITTEVIYKAPVRDMPVRWNSTFDMIM